MNRCYRGLAVLMLALPLAGCHSFGANQQAFRWPWSESENANDISQVAAIWADGLVVQPDPAQGGKVMPGFAGRIYLFNSDMTATREAQGSVIISLYDNTQPNSAEPVAKEVWNIDAASLARAKRKDTLGWGYNLWLPWSSMSQQATMVTLIVEYRDDLGRSLWSAPTTFPIRTSPGGGLNRSSALNVTAPRSK